MLAPLKLIRFLFLLYFNTKKSLSTMDVMGKMVARPLKNLSITKYVLWIPF